MKAKNWIWFFALKYCFTEISCTSEPFFSHLPAWQTDRKNTSYLIILLRTSPESPLASTQESPLAGTQALPGSSASLPSPANISALVICHCLSQASLVLQALVGAGLGHYPTHTSPPFPTLWASAFLRMYRLDELPWHSWSDTCQYTLSRGFFFTDLSHMEFKFLYLLSDLF